MDDNQRSDPTNLMAFFQRSCKCGHDKVLCADHLNNLLIRDDAHGLKDDSNRNVLKRHLVQLFKIIKWTEIKILKIRVH